MKENLLLKALENVLSKDTLTSSIIALLFMFLFNAIHKWIKRKRGNKWPKIMIAASLAIICILVLHSGATTLISYSHELRLGKTDKDLLLPPFYMQAILPFSYALVFTCYYWLRERWVLKINNIGSQLFAEGLLAFLVMNISLVMIFIITGSNLSQGIEILFPVWMSTPIGCCLGIVAYRYLNYISQFKIQQKELQIARLSQQITQSQLDTLSSRINPHFLYNSLNSIAGLSIEDSTKTRNMAIALSKLFRYNINREESNYARIREEAEMAELYLEIEKIRFEDRLQYSLNVQAGIENELIPRHLLQPLVENSVKHGAGTEGIAIQITIEKAKGITVIKVGDKGKPFDQDFNPGYGIKSLYDKLDILAPQTYEISFLTNPKEVRIEIGELKLMHHG